MVAYGAAGSEMELQICCKFWVSCTQVVNYNMYKAHYNKNPTQEFPPIPSVPITVPVDHNTLHMLCFTSRYEPQTGIHLAEENVQKIVTAIVDAAQQLDQDLHVKELQRAQRSKSGKAARTYFLKRNGSYGGMRQLKFSLSSNGQHHEEADGAIGECAAVFDDEQQNETCGRYKNAHDTSCTTSPYAPDICFRHSHKCLECLPYVPHSCSISPPYVPHVCLVCALHVSHVLTYACHMH